MALTGIQCTQLFGHIFGSPSIPSLLNTADDPNLGPQVPDLDPETGEAMLDLRMHVDEEEPSIRGIFARHLEIPHTQNKRRRRR